MSKGLRKALIGILILTAVAYAGAKLYARSQASTAIGEAKFALRDVVRLDYEGFSAGLDGSVTLQGLTISAVKGRGEVYAETLTVSAPNLPAALSARRDLTAGRLPQSLTLSAQGIRLNFDSPLYRRLNQWSKGWFIGTPWDHLACGDVQAIDAAALNDMGYTYLAANGRIKLTRGQDKRAALLSLHLNAEDIGQLRGEGVVMSPDGVLGTEALRLGTAGLADADLRYRDQGYFDSRNYYCAAQRDSDVGSFLHAHRLALAHHLRRQGAVPSDALIDAYTRLVASPGNEVHLAVAPPEPVPWGELGELDGEAFMARLAPEIAVNGKQVEEMAVRWVEPAAVAGGGDGDGDGQPARYYAADPAALKQLEGSYARLSTYDGTAYEGVISDASGSRITLQRRFQGGNMSFKVAVGDIQSAAIYRRRPLPPELQPQPEPEAETAKVVQEPAPEDQPAGESTGTPEQTVPDADETAVEPTPPTEGQDTEEPTTQHSDAEASPPTPEQAPASGTLPDTE